jgi:Amino acid permease
VTKKTEIPDWETLLAHAAPLQAKIPAAILVGGTAAAVHAGHRISFDHDHVVKDLAKNYDTAIRALESIAGWHTHRRVKGKMVLGNVNKIAAGLRNQRRSAPLETTEVVVQGGRRLRLPTIEETLRIKTFLVVDRNATRDYLDVAALSHHLGLTKSAAALERMNELYAEFKDETGDLLTAVVAKLALPDPYGLSVARLPFAMARDGLLPRTFATISPRARVPSHAILLLGACAVGFVFSGAFDVLTDLIVFMLLLFNGVAVASVYVLRRTLPDVVRPYRVWGYPVVPALFLLATAYLMINTLLATPGRALAGLGIVALGLPLYVYYARRLPPSRPEDWLVAQEAAPTHVDSH